MEEVCGYRQACKNLISWHVLEELKEGISCDALERRP